MIWCPRQIPKTGFAITVGTGQTPFGFSPFVGLGHRHYFRQVQADHGRRFTRRVDCRVDRRLGHCLPGRQTHDAAVLRALAADMPRQLAGVDIGDGDRVFLRQIGCQRVRLPEVGRRARQILDDEPGNLHLDRFDVLWIDAVISDVRIGQRDDLLAITGVGQDFLITRHGGVEHYFADAQARGADGVPEVDRAVRERQYSRRGISLERQKHGGSPS